MAEKEFNIIFSNNLKNLLLHSGMNQSDLAKKMGVSKSTVSSWVKGDKTPRMGKVDEMCDIFGCTRSDLMEDKKVHFLNQKKMVRIPLLGDVAGGIPIEMITGGYYNEYEEIPEDMAKTGEFFALKISGNSMAPRICDGDRVIVKAQPTAENGNVVIARIDHENATCKQFRRTRDGITLISWNPTYEPMFFSPHEVNTLPVEVIGKVVELRADI